MKCQRIHTQKRLSTAQEWEVVSKHPASPPLQCNFDTCSWLLRVPWGLCPGAPSSGPVMNAPLISLFPCLSSLLTPQASCDHSPNKLLAPKFLFQSLLWGKYKVGFMLPYEPSAQYRVGTQKYNHIRSIFFYEHLQDETSTESTDPCEVHQLQRSSLCTQSLTSASGRGVGRCKKVTRPLPKNQTV